MNKVILCSGNLGFIASHLTNHLRTKYPDYKIVGVDSETPAADRSRIKCPIYDWSDWNYNYPLDGIIQLKGDLSESHTHIRLKRLFKLEGYPCIVIHAASESHVDNSLQNPTLFWKSNVLGTQRLMQTLKECELNHARILSIATDEIIAGSGTLDQLEPFDENSPINASSPYANSKASGELVVDSYVKSFNFTNTVSVRCVNNYGPGQKEKLIPTAINSLLKGESIKLYGQGRQMRDWLFVQDFVDALEILMFNDLTGHINISANDERTNLDVANKIVVTLLTDAWNPIEFIEDPRKGCHDARYFISSEKFRNLTGWKPKVTFEEGLRRTINEIKETK